MSTWLNTTSSNTTFYIPATTTATTIAGPPQPKPQTPLEWLDAEIERTCALARAA